MLGAAVLNDFRNKKPRETAFAFLLRLLLEFVKIALARKPCVLARVLGRVRTDPTILSRLPSKVGDIMKLAISLTNLASYQPDDVISPIKERLESYERLNFACRSPERISERNDKASTRAGQILKERQERARQHNGLIDEKRRRRDSIDKLARESIKIKLEAAFDNAASRRTALHEAFKDRLARREEASKQRLNLAATERAKRGAKIEQKLQAAATRRVEHRRQVIASAAKAGVVKPETAVAGSEPTAASPPTTYPVAPLARAPLIDLTAPAARPCTEAAVALMHQLRTHVTAANDFGAVSEWMRSAETIELMSSCLRELGLYGEDGGSGGCGDGGAAQKHARLAICMVVMHLHASLFFDADSANDKIMRREARRFALKLKRALHATPMTTAANDKAGVPPAQAASCAEINEEEAFGASFERAARFHAAWAAMDRPQTLDFLLSSVVAVKAKQREQGLPLTPPVETFAQVRLLGGDAAEAEARRRYDGSWSSVKTADLAESVVEVAQRAFWDALADRVGAGDYDGLFGVLAELQQAMRALVSHSPHALDELDDKFDAAWLKQQAAHGALDIERIQGLMRYVMATISSWQASADMTSTREWCETVEESLAASVASNAVPDAGSGAVAGDSNDGERLDAFVAAHLLPFLRGAIERVGRVYTRMMELKTSLEKRRAEEAEAEGTQLAEQD